MIAGVIYPRGDSEAALVNALSELLNQPNYKFAEMIVPRALVLTDHFAPEGHSSDREYLSFIFNPQTTILEISSTDHTVVIPEWIIKYYKPVNVTKINPQKTSDKLVYLLHLNSEDK
ncbi:hypothetical protein ASD24_24295 [Paenibacillus sp. Root52]|uniref:hypothetical protein n=1 Tax=Paenibacillus sp. Root52 TaxID=1736552 RepID=UPI0006F91F55|nr:hypothetical protein [Paenibacillus sp. Root52]KQY90922.1 hypothetical protein ASD24_24295 [Paenibacillus sp. Root52]